jgi:hypothetical protein
MSEERKNRTIPFSKWSEERIKTHKKSCTSRHKKYSHDNRVLWISPKLPFWFIKKYLWKDEGANSPEELQEIVNEIYGRIVEPNEMFFVHFGNFEKANKSEN